MAVVSDGISKIGFPKQLLGMLAEIGGVHTGSGQKIGNEGDASDRQAECDEQVALACPGRADQA